MRKLRRGRPAGLLAALGLGGCIAAASASQAAAFDPAPPEGPMGLLESAGSLPADRSFRYPGNDIIRVFNPPPRTAYAGGTAPGSPSLDAMLDHVADD